MLQAGTCQGLQSKFAGAEERPTTNFANNCRAGTAGLRTVASRQSSQGLDRSSYLWVGFASYALLRGRQRGDLTRSTVSTGSRHLCEAQS